MTIVKIQPFAAVASWAEISLHNGVLSVSLERAATAWAIQHGQIAVDAEPPIEIDLAQIPFPWGEYTPAAMKARPCPSCRGVHLQKHTSLEEQVTAYLCPDCYGVFTLNPRWGILVADAATAQSMRDGSFFLGADVAAHLWPVPASRPT